MHRSKAGYNPYNMFIFFTGISMKTRSEIFEIIKCWLITPKRLKFDKIPVFFQ